MRVESLAVSKLAKRYGASRALAGVDLTMTAGRMCALLGPNGAGKLTLLGILLTLVRPSSGRVTFRAGDRELEPGPELRSRIGVLAHESFIYGELTGWENLLFYARLYHVEDGAARARQLLDRVGLEDRAAERQARTYSRGMTQRLALARALLHDPEVLLLDEPFTGLDRTGAAALASTLADAKAQGKVMVVVTHDFDAIAGVADHVVVLRRGKIAFETDRRDPFSRDELEEMYHRHAE